MKFNYKIFAFWREKRKMTLEEVGNAVGVSKQTVQKWEAGQVVPRRGKIMAISKLFNIPTYDISDLAIDIEEPNSQRMRLDEALSDPMFEIVMRDWRRLSAADKGELIDFMQKKLKNRKEE